MSNKLKVLFVSRDLIAGDLAYRLKREGCDVKLYIEGENEKECFDGMITKTSDWKNELEWVQKDGLIIFDDVGYGELQDNLRKEGYLVVGGSGDGDKLELDRKYGQEVLKACGVQMSDEFETMPFTLHSAIVFVKKHKGRWVLKKENHDEEVTYISEREDGADLLSILEKYKRYFGGSYKCSLQKRVLGVEIAVGRFFNGKDWYGPLVFNIEHKNFCNDDIGPLGGETGTLMWYEGDENKKLFQQTLAKLKPHLERSSYKGYVDVNCIVVGENVVYPLEITSRFGSSTNETQSEIHKSPWSEFLLSMAKEEDCRLKYKSGYAINVALTVSPFPYQSSDKKLSQKGVDIFFGKELSEKDFSHIHFEEVAFRKENSSYYIAGNTGYVLYITGTGKTVHSARRKVYGLIDKIIIPKVFYRTDIGLRFVRKDQELLNKWKWI